MNKISMENKANEALSALRDAVHDALLEKKANGHYAIFAGRNGESIRVEAKDIHVRERVSSNKKYT